jgi:hypothetical protein
MLARVLFVSGLAIVMARRFISGQKKKNESIEECLTEDTKGEATTDVVTEQVSSCVDDTTTTPEAEESITFSGTTVTREPSVITEGEVSLVDSTGEATSAFKSVDAITIDVEASSKSVDVFLGEGVTPRTNSLKKMAESMKRKLSGSRKSMTP